MKALTICQPYAHMIALPTSDDLHKRVENRTWPTKYRGPLAIHAGMSRKWLSDGDEDRFPGMVYGAIVAVANLVECAPIHELHRHAKRFPWLLEHVHVSGPFCWILQDVHPLTRPPRIKGELGLWDVPPGFILPDPPKAVRA